MNDKQRTYHKQAYEHTTCISERAYVYQAVHTIFVERLAAIKLLHTVHLGKSQEREPFVREVQGLALLKHPFLLPFLDAGFHKGVPCLVTEYAPNGSLSDYLTRREHRVLSLDEALTILAQVGQFLHYAHQKGLLHRNLKPENILFNAQGDALLTGFESATALAATRGTRMVASGTPAYMAPERFRGEVSKQSDQYVLGCLAFELVTGHLPSEAPDFIAIGFLQATAVPLALTSYVPSFPNA